MQAKEKTLAEVLKDLEELEKKSKEASEKETSYDHRKGIQDRLYSLTMTLAQHMDKENPFPGDNPSYQTYLNELRQARRSLGAAKNLSGMELSGTTEKVMKMEGKEPEVNSTYHDIGKYLAEAKQGVERAMRNPAYKKMKK